LWLAALLLVRPALAGETVTFFHNDVLGSPLMATDASGNVVWKEKYRPYGERLDNPPAEANNKIGYAGKPYDTNTGLSYFGARYYDPVGPVAENIHSLNRYTYANNNPYRYTDPNGMWAEDAVLAIPGIVLGSRSLVDNIREGKWGAGVVDVGGLIADTIAVVIPGVPGGAGLAIAATRKTAIAMERTAAKNASELPLLQRGAKDWDEAVDALSRMSSGKANFRTETASDAKDLLREARGNMDRRKQYTTDRYKKGYETHNEQNARELGVGNDLQHLKWKDGKAGGHIYYDNPN
ncbi:MAG: RHS domain-containing protein, partial [Rhodocyclaceae bacterium]|nr:RHS domain-containing protein [Rhodocyclaceae bacterium]